MDVNLLRGWLPIRLFPEHGRMQVDWAFFGPRPLTEPFFEQSVGVVLQHPACLLFRHQTPIEVLGELAAAEPGLPPAGFIFHMSRCGSTLIAQMLATLPEHLVLSEPQVLEQVLRAERQDSRADQQQRIVWLRWLLSALMRQRGGSAQRAFLKLDCWHSLDMPLLRRAFPDVPWIFVYRDPVEVLVSNLRETAARMLPGPVEAALLGLDLASAYQLPLEERCAQALAAFCRAALASTQPRPLLVEYRQLPDAVMSQVAPWFGLNLSQAEHERMHHVASRHAKHPQAPFQADSAEKQRAADADLRELAAKLLTPLYEQLETARYAW